MDGRRLLTGRAWFTLLAASTRGSCIIEVNVGAIGTSGGSTWDDAKADRRDAGENNGAMGRCPAGMESR